MGKKIRMKSKGYIRNPYSRYSMDTVKLLVYVFVMLAIPVFGVRAKARRPAKLCLGLVRTRNRASLMSRE
jgi:hypothetical protein